jgi:signal transduction histidine kinase
VIGGDEMRSMSRCIVIASASASFSPIFSATRLDKLFEPFFRGKARASKQGLGLGLYIASQIRKGPWGT